MGTPFAVASEFEVSTMKHLHWRAAGCTTQERATRTRMRNKGWIKEVRAGEWNLTDAGRVALELFEALDGAKLTPAGARGLMRQPCPTPVTTLLREGLVSNEGTEYRRTERGNVVREILRKYRVEV